MIASSSLGSTGRPLRLLIVDDNHINLSILSTLLRRRFSHILDGAPVTVDSGLKAIQLLRTHVFDCIFMDIQMPFLSGLDATRRIRNAEDGILPANSDAHIVAVTTAVGPEPELAYRRARMDGMMGKPVRFQSLQQYLSPLAQQASISAQSVKPIIIDGMQVMPPLPPASIHQRAFYLPVDATTPASRPDICKGEDFEKLLDGQTRASLRQCGPLALERNGKSKRNCPNPQTRDDICTHFASDAPHLMPSTIALHHDTSSDVEVVNAPSFHVHRSSSSTAASHPTQMVESSLSRNLSMTISQKTLDKQIAREMANADLQREEGFNNHMSPRSIRRVQSRPQVTHRTSSPGWLLSEELTKQKSALGLKSIPKEQTVVATRPKLAVLCAAKATPSTSSSSFSASGIDGQSTTTTPPLRRESQVSSSSNGSGSSSNITTPSLDEAPSFFWANQTAHGMKCCGKEHQRFSSNTTVNPFSERTDVYGMEGTSPWDHSIGTVTDSSSSPCKDSIWSQCISAVGKDSVIPSNDLSPLQQVVQERQMESLQNSLVKNKYEQYDASEEIRTLQLQ